MTSRDLSSYSLRAFRGRCQSTVTPGSRGKTRGHPYLECTCTIEDEGFSKFASMLPMRRRHAVEFWTMVKLAMLLASSYGRDEHVYIMSLDAAIMSNRKSSQHRVKPLQQNHPPAVLDTTNRLSSNINLLQSQAILFT